MISKHIKQLIAAKLRRDEYDGFFNSDIECACSLSDLCLCEEPPGPECTPGFLCPCDCGDHDWHIGPQKAPAASERSPQ